MCQRDSNQYRLSEHSLFLSLSPSLSLFLSLSSSLPLYFPLSLSLSLFILLFPSLSFLIDLIILHNLIISFLSTLQSAHARPRADCKPSDRHCRFFSCRRRQSERVSWFTHGGGGTASSGSCIAISSLHWPSLPLPGLSSPYLDGPGTPRVFQTVLSLLKNVAKKTFKYFKS
jgi:hypothetical protein